MFKRALYIGLVATMTACGSTYNMVKTTVQESDLGNDAESIVSARNNEPASNHFWGKLLGEACREVNRENICLSPLSAQFAMAMVANGAEGNTKQEICTAMQLGDSVNERCRGLLDNIATKTVWSKHSEVKIAN